MGALKTRPSAETKSLARLQVQPERISRSPLYKVLTTAAGLMSGGHAKRTQAKSQAGSSVSPLSSSACRFSIDGAIIRAVAIVTGSWNTIQYDGLAEEAHDAVCELLGRSDLMKWNDLAVGPAHVARVLSQAAELQ